MSEYLYSRWQIQKQSSSLLPTPGPLFNLGTGTLDARSQRSPLNRCTLKCLQSYISYFRGVGGQAQQSHTVNARGREAGARGGGLAEVGGESIGITLQLENFRLLQKYIYKKPSPGGVGSAGASRRTGPRAGRGCGSPAERARCPTGDTGLGWGRHTGRVAGAAHGGPGPPGTLRVLPPARHRRGDVRFDCRKRWQILGRFPGLGDTGRAARPGRTWGCPGHGGTDPQPPAPSSRDGQHPVRVGAQDMLLPDRLTDTGVGLGVASSARNPGELRARQQLSVGTAGRARPSSVRVRGFPGHKVTQQPCGHRRASPRPLNPACPADQTAGVTRCGE